MPLADAYCKIFISGDWTCRARMTLSAIFYSPKQGFRQYESGFPIIQLSQGEQVFCDDEAPLVLQRCSCNDRRRGSEMSSTSPVAARLRRIRGVSAGNVAQMRDRSQANLLSAERQQPRSTGRRRTIASDPPLPIDWVKGCPTGASCRRGYGRDVLLTATWGAGPRWSGPSGGRPFFGEPTAPGRASVRPSTLRRSARAVPCSTPSPEQSGEEAEGRILVFSGFRASRKPLG
jgi:hypothetical protein